MSLPSLTISADKLSFLEDGQPWVQRGILAWPLYGRYLNEGADVVRAVLKDYRSVGANTVACAGMLSWWPGLTPQNIAYWNGLRPFTDLATEEGIRLQWVVCCDTATLMPDRASLLAHWERFLVTLGDKTNVTFVAVNQPYHPTQSRECDPGMFVVPKNFPTLLCARDNPMESGNPTLPPLHFSCACTSRDEVKGYVEVGSSLWYIVNGWPGDPAWTGSKQVSVLFEGPHFREYGTWSDPGKARQLARSLSFKGTGGGNFYCDLSAQAERLTGSQRDCAVEFLGNIPNV